MGYKKDTVLKTAFDSYIIGNLLGSGASGEVFEAIDSDGVRRAIKILNPGILNPARSGATGLKPARDEFHFCFRSSHKNIVPVLDCGRTGPKAVFYVMPLYAQSLRIRLAKGIPPEDVLRIFGQILDGIEAAHLHGISHRNLKPENILLGPSGKDLVVADFGVAPFEAPLLENSKSQEPIAFPYAAPEQKIRGHAVDSRADVYALGILLHEMFTGKTTIGLGHADISDAAHAFAYLDWTVRRMTNPEPTRRLSIPEVKRELIARGNEFLSLQRLNAMKTEVLSEAQVDDPILRNPIKIQSADFKGETLYLTLSTIPPPSWIAAFQGLASNSSSAHTGHGPDRYIFLGKLAHLRVARRADPQQLLDFAKAYVEAAHKLYAEQTLSAHRQNLEFEREKLRAKIAAEERRHQFLARLSI